MIARLAARAARRAAPAAAALALLATDAGAGAELDEAPHEDGEPLAREYDAWRPVAPPAARSGHVAVVDPATGRLFTFGGGDLMGHFDDLWVLKDGPGAEWSPVPLAGPRPSARIGAATALDTRRRRLLVMGGSDGALRSDLWALSLDGAPRWTQLLPDGPTGVAFARAAYDSARDRMIVHGGFDGAASAEMEVIRFDGPIPIRAPFPAPAGPAPRFKHVVLHDADQDRLVIHGGLGSTALADAWSLKLDPSGVAAGWSRLEPAGEAPGRRYGHVAVHDPARGRLIVFGGYDGRDLADTWSLDLVDGAWERLAVGVAPTPRADAAAALDPATGRVHVVGGFGALAAHTNDVWTLDLDGATPWMRRSATGSPVARGEHTLVLDARRGRLIVFGGNAGSGSVLPYRPGTFVQLDDTWIREPGPPPRWIRVPSPPAPPPRRGHTAIHDPVADRILVFGGWSGTAVLNDVWALELAGDPRWRPLATTGAPPPPRGEHAAVYDPVRRRMLVHGGFVYYGGYLGDLWALSLDGPHAWSRLPVTGSGIPRCHHVLAHDPARDRLVLFGGETSFTIRNDVHTLDLAGPLEWTSLAPHEFWVGPRPAYGAVGGVDAGRDRLVVFGGDEDTQTFDALWELPLAGGAWREIAPPVARPDGRGHAAAALDAENRRLYLHGGRRGERKLADLWVLDFGARSFHVADTPAGGTGPTVDRPQGGNGRLGANAPPDASGLALDAAPVPAGAALTLSLRLHAAGAVRLDVHDPAGRLVRRLERGWREAGPHRLAWDLRDGAGARVAPGVYLAVLTSSAGRRVRRVAVLGE